MDTAVRSRRSPPPDARRRAFRRGFTLVEMMVVTVLIVILASLTLAGLTVARSRAKADKTRSTLRKLHEIIVPHYESYLNRRVPFTTSGNARTNALNRLVAIRTLMVREMPDDWADVASSAGALPAYLRTGPVMTYSAIRSMLPNRTDAEGSGECLYMIVARGGLEPDLLEQFRTDEIGDTDNDGAREFLDGWNDAIVFLRWAPAFRSALQDGNATTSHDPFDPQMVDAAGFAMVPLLVSGGPDTKPGIITTGSAMPASGWSGLTLQSVVTVGVTVGGVVNATEFRDNVTNHDLVTR